MARSEPHTGGEPQSDPDSHHAESPGNGESPHDQSSPSDELARLRAELAHTQDRYRRALADLDNYRKRVERDAARREGEVRMRLDSEWLEALDSVERALRMHPADTGLSAVLEQMEAILARHGVVRLDAVGTRFDPARHEAIAARPATDVADYTVLDVARSGFSADDGTVLRPAQVVVSRQPTGSG